MENDKTRNKIIASNIRSFILKRGITQKELARAINISPSTLSDYLNLRSNPSHGVIQRIANYFEVAKSDIDTTYKEDNNTILNSRLNEFSKYNYFNTAVSAGALEPVETFTSNNIEELELPDKILGKYAGRTDIFITRLNGESMNKVIPNNSLIAVKRITEKEELSDNDIVVFRNGGEVAIKRFFNDAVNNRLIFKPDSTDISFTDIVVGYDEEYAIYGKVVVYVVEL